MEARRGKGLSNSGPLAGKIAALGKENVCPTLRSRLTLSESRSPLPEGFPRAPLQDITDILSPIHVLPHDDDGDVAGHGLCRRGRKRSAETQTPSCIGRCGCEHFSSEDWRGLRKCATASSHLQVKSELKPMEDVPTRSLLNVEESAVLKDEAERTDAAESKEESLLCSETRAEEQLLAGRVLLEADAIEASFLARSVRTIPKRPLKPTSSSPATRAKLRSSEDKQKVSSLMKFR